MCNERGCNCERCGCCASPAAGVIGQREAMGIWRWAGSQTRGHAIVKEKKCTSMDPCSAISCFASSLLLICRSAQCNSDCLLSAVFHWMILHAESCLRFCFQHLPTWKKKECYFNSFPFSQLRKFRDLQKVIPWDLTTPPTVFLPRR